MPSKNVKTYAEKVGSKLRDGGNVETAVKAEEINELDKQEVQSEILNPPVETIRMMDGSEVELKTVFSLNDIVKRRIHNTLSNFVKVVAFEVAKMTKDVETGRTQEETAAWFSRNLFYMMTVLDKPAVSSIMADALAILSGKPAHHFEVLDSKESEKAANILFKLYAKELESQGSSKEKN
jgi:hypothetical protein